MEKSFLVLFSKKERLLAGAAANMLHRNLTRFRWFRRGHWK